MAQQKKDSERERQARLQRMLARDQGKTLTDLETLRERTQTGGAGVRTPQRVRRTASTQQIPRRPVERETVQTAEPDNTRRLAPLLHRRKRRNRILILLLVLAVLLFAAYISGALTGAAIMAGDMADSAYLYFNRASGGWPVITGIRNPTQVKELAGGFVEMDGSDIAVYSAYGNKIRSMQPGYARPALAVGNTRFAVYNRTGTEVRIESRTKNLYTANFDKEILFCSMSNNGTLAVVTESDRYMAELRVLDATFRNVYSWSLTQNDGTPLSVAFAPDNHRFAAGTVAAKDGQLQTSIYMMDINDAETGPAYTADPGSMIIELQWLSAHRLLAVFDTYTVILDPTTAAEAARYDYGGATLQSVSVGGKNAALLLVVRGGNTLVTLDENLAVCAMIPAGQADRVSCVETAVYLLTGDLVECYGVEGTQKWTKTLSAHPVAVLQAEKTLIFYGDTVEELSAPAA